MPQPLLDGPPDPPAGLVKGRTHVPTSLVLFDGWYLSPELIAWLDAHELDWVSLVKKNRKLKVNSFQLRDAQGQPAPLDGPHIKIEDLAPLIPKTAFKPVQLKDQTYYCFTFTCRIPSLGKVRPVISFKDAELEGSYVVVVSNRLDWSAHKILVTYLQRWPIETFYQDGKGHLGLDEYRMRRAEAIRKHWSLVFVAYSQ